MGERVYELRTVRPPKFRVRSVHELSASSLRFKCNSLLHLNRGLPGSVVYDLSTVRQLRYQPLLSESEFTKFFVLLRNLSPFCVVLVDPSNNSRRLDRCPQVSRRNIEFVLAGHPDAVPLFT